VGTRAVKLDPVFIATCVSVDAAALRQVHNITFRSPSMIRRKQHTKAHNKKQALNKNIIKTFGLLLSVWFCKIFRIQNA
jgi:hypothetical protein